MDDVIYFLTETKVQDTAGIFHSITGRRMAYCKVASVTRSEFYNAGRSGLNPEFEVSVFGADYEDEELAEYNGKTYSIYRTYRVPGTDYIELYLERKGGSNGRESTAGRQCDILGVNNGILDVNNGALNVG